MKYKVGILLALLGIAVFGARGANNPAIVDVELDIEGVAADDGATESEWSPGGFVGVGCRKKIIVRKVQPGAWGTTVGDSYKRLRLSWASTKIKVYTSADGTTEVASDTEYANGDLPTAGLELWVEGVTASSEAGTDSVPGQESILAMAIPDGDWDRIAFTVIEMDIDGDLNRDGTYDEDDDAEHTAPGLIVAVNDDDDDGDGIADMDDGYNADNSATPNDDDAVAGENDLVVVRLKGLPQDVAVGSVVLKLASGTDKIRVWGDSGKGPTPPAAGSPPGTPSTAGSPWLDAATTEKTWTLPTDIATLAALPVSVTIEGIDAGTAQLELTYKDAAGNEVHKDTLLLTVLKVDLDVDSNNDGTIDATDDNEDKFEKDVPGVLVCLDGMGMEVPPADGECYVPLKLNIAPILTTGSLMLEALFGGVSAPVRVWATPAGTGPIASGTAGNIPLSSLPSTLWIDGIALGHASLKLTYNDAAGNAIYSDSVEVRVVDTISYAPSGNSVFTWQPVQYSGAAGAPLDLSVTHSVLASHGWDVTTCGWEDTTDDDDPGECTHARFRAAGKGINLFLNHGGAGGAVAVYFTTEIAANNWYNSESYDKTGMMVFESSLYGRWGVWVSADWFKNNWKPYQNDMKAITVMMCCHGAEPIPTSPNSSVMANVGGRVVMAYTGLADASQFNPDMETFFGRLAGTISSWYGGRTAGRAWNGGTGYSPNLRMVRNDWTTLGPAVQYRGKTGFHDNKGAATIAFDTYMDSGVSADTAVIITAGSGSARRWFAPVEATAFKPRIYGISCDLTGPTATSLKAQAGNCLNEHIPGANGRKVTSFSGTYGQDETW